MRRVMTEAGMARVRELEVEVARLRRVNERLQEELKREREKVSPEEARELELLERWERGSR